MPALLPAIHFFLFLGFFSHFTPGFSLREKFMGSSIAWSVQLVLLTELLSSCSLVTFNALLCYWLLTILLLGVAWRTKKVKLLLHIRVRTKEAWQASTGFEKTLLASVGLLLVSLGIIAIVTPPNTWDSMTYHMARVAHWAQNGNVSHYPTHITRQHYQPPFAEYVILHLQLLSGGDRLANLVQWGSYTGTLIGVSLMTKRLGGDKSTQILSIFLAATLPMAVLQANSTQNDLVCTYWVVCGAYYLTGLFTARYVGSTVLAGMATALAVFTKATSYFWLFPFFAGLGVYLLFVKRQFKTLTLVASTTLLCIVLINAAQYHRNYQVYGHLLGGTVAERRQYTNVAHSMPKMASNVIRNTVLHLRIPSYYWGRAVRIGTLKIHRWMGISIHEPDITYYSSGNLAFYGTWAGSEDTTGNTLHSLLILAVFAVIFAQRERLCGRYLRGYTLMSVGGFLLFCFLLRWQEWHSRLHLPFFALMMPVCAVALPMPRVFKILALSALFLYASVCIALNMTKPMTYNSESPYKSPVWKQKRIEMYAPPLHKDYLRTAAFLARQNPKSVGLVLGIDDGDYLFWVYLRRLVANPLQIRHINVRNPSARLAAAGPIPAYAVVSLRSGGVLGGEYKRIGAFGNFHIYKNTTVKE